MSLQETPPAALSFGANRWDTAEFHSTEERSKFQRLMVCLFVNILGLDFKPLAGGFLGADLPESSV